jgi:hypothetical protein
VTKLATYNKFEDFVEQLGKGVHQLHAAGHTLKIYASNATPDAALDAVKADLAEITAQNGYPAGGSDIQNDYTETGGTGTLTGVNVTWTASGGSFGPLKYIVLYNDTPTSPLADPVIAWWEYPSAAVTVLDGESFQTVFGASVLTIV